MVVRQSDLIGACELSMPKKFKTVHCPPRLESLEAPVRRYIWEASLTVGPTVWSYGGGQPAPPDISLKSGAR